MAVHSKIKWLYPGMRVKRWLLLLGLGVVFVGAGASLAFGVELFLSLEEGVIRPLARIFGTFPVVLPLFAGLLLILLGVLFIVIGLRQTIRSLTAIFLPDKVDQLADIVFERRQLLKGPQIVVIGGGTGLSTLLRGLKEHTGNITAIVTMADDGGSSGRIRHELGIPPPGDIRSTLVALADTEPLMELLFQYRFHDGEGLKGHSFGNLFIAAMTEITGDFELAVQQSSKVLAVRGRVFPSTLEDVILRAEYEDGSVASGESQISNRDKRIRRVFLSPENPKPLSEAVKAIEEADCIVLGPGSLYTSIIPNLLVGRIAEAIKASKATKIYVCNVMTQPGETDGFTASDHAQAIIDHCGSGIIEHVILNDALISPAVMERYGEQGAHPVMVDEGRLRQLKLVPHVQHLITGDDLARHDSEKLARAVMHVLHATQGFWSIEQRALKVMERRVSG